MPLQSYWSRYRCFRKSRSLTKENKRELEIKMIMTEFEADLSMAKFAVEHDCPVLSNDSEFAVFSKVKWIKVRVILFSIRYKIYIVLS